MTDAPNTPPFAGPQMRGATFEKADMSGARFDGVLASDLLEAWRERAR